MPPQLFDSGLSSALSGSDFALPDMNMDYGQLPSMSGADPFASMYPQSAQYGQMMPQMTPDQMNVMDYQQAGSKPSIFKTLVGSIMIGLAGGAQSDDFLGGFAGGMGKMMQYQEQQRQNQIQEEELKRKAEMDQRQMDLMLSQKLQIDKNTQLLDAQEQRRAQELELQQIKTIDSMDGVDYVMSTDDTPEGRQMVLDKMKDQNITFFPTIDPNDNKLTAWRINPDAKTTTDIHVTLPGPNGQMRDEVIPAGTDAVKALQIQVQASQIWSSDTANKRSTAATVEASKQRAEYGASTQSTKFPPQWTTPGAMDERSTRESSVIQQNMNQYNNDLEQYNKEMDYNHYEAGTPEYDQWQNKVNAATQGLNLAKERQAELINNMSLPPIGATLPEGTVYPGAKIVDYNGAMVVLNYKGQLVQWDPKNKTKIK